MNHIVIGTDLQPDGKLVAHKAVDLAKKMGSKVTLVHVINNMVVPGNTFPDPLGNLETLNVTTDLQIMEEQQRMVDETLNELKESFSYPIDTKIAYGSLDEALLDAAEELKADLLVIGVHHSSGLLRFLEGDVSSSILHHTKIPLLVIPVEKESDK